ncbi:MAG TPA: energy transducer TonB, partial [Desulfobacteraceae bacterium]|nr:energy transducer TonB [Desulfobacteraceae bacterium]
IRAVEKWSFEPGSKNGNPVDMWVKIPVRFQLD